MMRVASPHRSMTERFLREWTCTVCGRRFPWRREWARDRDSVRHCSDQCQRRGISRFDVVIEETILDLARDRARFGSDICPTEVARFLEPDDWRTITSAVRMAARRLADRDLVEIRQRGRAIDAASARGAFRLASAGS